MFKLVKCAPWKRRGCPTIYNDARLHIVPLTEQAVAFIQLDARLKLSAMEPDEVLLDCHWVPAYRFLWVASSLAVDSVIKRLSDLAENWSEVL